MKQADRTRARGLIVACSSVMVLSAGVCSGAIVSAAGPGVLDAMMGMPLLAVTDDGMPLGTLYGHPPTFIPGMPLTTPIGPMGFGPSHERVGLGTPFSSGAFMAVPPGSPIAGSTVFAPDGANAMDFFISGAFGSSHVFEITAVGSGGGTASVVVAAGAAPTYVGFGSFGESILFFSIVKMPFPSPTFTTWIIEDIRVLPAPGVLPALLGGLGLAARRRRD